MNLIQKFKESKFCRSLSAVFISAMIACMFCVSAFAADGEAVSTDMTSVLSDSLNSMLTNLMGYVYVALPIALSIVAAFFGIKKAISFFKSVSNKG